jgi:hypothetical protein
MKVSVWTMGAALAGLLLFSAALFADFAADDEAYTLFDLLHLQLPARHARNE